LICGALIGYTGYMIKWLLVVVLLLLAGVGGYLYMARYEPVREEVRGGGGERYTLGAALDRAANDCKIIDGLIVNGEIDNTVRSEYSVFLAQEFSARNGNENAISSGAIIPNTPGCYFIEDGRVMLYQRNDGELVTISIEGIETDDSSTPEIISGLPDELSNDFDPTTNTPVFKILAVEPNQRSLRFKMVFPAGYLQEEIISTLSCSEEDMRVEKGGVVMATGSQAFFEFIGDNIEESLTMRGLCRDFSCKEISKQCVLYLY
jgi:hypothetical protein